jgi:hypothetical protein
MLRLRAERAAVRREDQPKKAVAARACSHLACHVATALQAWHAVYRAWFYVPDQACLYFSMNLSCERLPGHANECHRAPCAPDPACLAMHAHLVMSEMVPGLDSLTHGLSACSAAAAVVEEGEPGPAKKQRTSAQQVRPSALPDTKCAVDHVLLAVGASAACHDTVTGYWTRCPATILVLEADSGWRFPVLEPGDGWQCCHVMREHPEQQSTSAPRRHASV